MNDSWDFLKRAEQWKNYTEIWVTLLVLSKRFIFSLFLYNSVLCVLYNRVNITIFSSHYVFAIMCLDELVNLTHFWGCFLPSDFQQRRLDKITKIYRKIKKSQVKNVSIVSFSVNVYSTQTLLPKINKIDQQNIKKHKNLIKS